MKAAVKSLIATGILWRATATARASGHIVLTYHHVGTPTDYASAVPPEVFRDQMRWLVSHCDVVDPDAFPRGAPKSGRGTPSVLITFDDAYSDYHDVVCPILRKLGIRVINFLPTRYIDEGRSFWWTRLEHAVSQSFHTSIVPPWTEKPVLLDRTGRRRLVRDAKSRLKMFGRPDESPIFVELMRRLDADDDPPTIQKTVMSWDQVRATADVTTFGGHTHTHSLMSRLPENEQEDEAMTCRQRIANETGSAARLFAYPSGDHNDGAKRAVARAGFELAFTTIPGFAGDMADRFAIKRSHAPGSVAELAWHLTGWFHRA